MIIRFSAHAEQQIKIRSLSRDLILYTIKRPDQIIEQEGDIIIFQRLFLEVGKEYLLRVAARTQEGKLLVLTAYRTSKIRKYKGGVDCET